jgi:hypothetical protein
MVVCCQNLMLSGLSGRSALSVLVGALFKKFSLFLNTPRTSFKEGKRKKEGRRDGKKEIKNINGNLITNYKTSHWSSRKYSQSKCGLTKQWVGLPKAASVV